ncbi:MAG: hypothetical protein LUF34_10640 [Lachnospiraceae bacterium]|nr:hypothetical protein [Lachnospiraceae bacterium]
MSNSQSADSSPFSGMSPEKVMFLTQMMGQMQGKSAADLMSVLSGAGAAAHGQNLQFSDSEADQVLSALLPNMSQEEKKKVEMMRSLSRILSLRGKK